MGKFAFDPDLASETVSSLAANGFSSDFSKPSDDSGGGGADAFLTACQALSDLLYVYRPVDAVGALSPSDDAVEDIHGSGVTGVVGSTANSVSIIDSMFSAPSLSRAIVRDAGASPDGNPPPPTAGVAVGLSGPTEGTWVFIMQGDLDTTAVHTAVSMDNSGPSTDQDRRANLYTLGANLNVQFPRGTITSSMAAADFTSSGAMLVLTRDSATNTLQSAIAAPGGSVSLGSNVQGTLDWDGCVLMCANSSLGAPNFDGYGVVAAVAYDRVLSNADLQTILDAVA